MTHMQAHDEDDVLRAARRRAQLGGHVQQAQIMVLAAGLAAFGIVAVAAAMMSTLF
jgi:hypothetical protein